MAALKDKTVLVIGRGSGIARAVTMLSLSEGARVIVAGRDRAALAAAYEAVLFAMANAFLTGVTLKIDGGEPLT